MLRCRNAKSPKCLSHKIHGTMVITDSRGRSRTCEILKTADLAPLVGVSDILLTLKGGASHLCLWGP